LGGWGAKHLGNDSRSQIIVLRIAHGVPGTKQILWTLTILSGRRKSPL
jgi:hypothetical protein